MMGPRFKQGSCRLCLWESNSLWDIFEELAERRNFARKIQACVNINVSKDDGMSSLICPNCIYKIELFYDFQTSCKRSDEIQKRYNEIQDVEFADCDAMEDVLPTMGLHCGVSNSQKDAQGPLETIDIKEEPIDDDEVPVDGIDDEQFEDAEVEIEEVVTVIEDRQEEGISATEHHQLKEKDKEDGGGGANGSCLQLTPPRSPSLASEVTYSASEAGTAGSAVGDSSEQEQQQQEDGEGRQLDVSGGGCGHCAEGHPDPHTCREHEPSCSCHKGTTHRQQHRQEVAVAPKPLPPSKYYNRCRFCKKWFQKVGVCRVHEITCAAQHGYAPPPPPTTSRRCRFCSGLFGSIAGRGSHEYHCFRRQRQLVVPQTAADPRRELPPPAKYCQQCRFCRKYFRRLVERRSHEVQCGSQFGYTPEQLRSHLRAASPARQGGRRKCSLCGKMLKSVKGRIRHEDYCRRTSAQMRGLLSTLSQTPHSPATDQCRYCHARFQSLPQCVSHELSCTEVSGCPDGPEANAASPSGGQDAVKCRYCGKGHLKWRSLMTHEYHCRRKAPPRTEADTELQRDPEVAGLVRDESASPVESFVSKDERQGPLNRCSYCRKWFRSKNTCKVHEYVCSHNVRMTVKGRYSCSFCPRKFLKRGSCVIHERYCRHASDRTGHSATVSRAEGAAEWQRESAPIGCEKVLSGVESTDRHEVISLGMLEQKRKKVDSLLYTPVANSTKETETWTCQYCDKCFKYRECLRSHEVKCSAIATYQYNNPYSRPPSLFTCPLCRKAFKFRRKLHNHWTVCKARTSVLAEAVELNGVAKPTRARFEQLEGIGAGGAVSAPFGKTSSPGDDREEWRGWPSSHSQTVVDLLTDEDSNASVVDSCGLSCKLCKKDFSSRVLLELHTLNECVHQRIRNDHAYAQCESPGVDEFTLMRMARVELQRLLLCSCCGSIFVDRQALAEHEMSERQRHSGTPTGAENLSPYDPEATHLQKRIKLGKVMDDLDFQLEDGGQQESSCRVEQLTTSDQVVSATITKLDNTDSRQDSNKNCLLRNFRCGSDNKQCVRKVESEKQVKGDDIQQQEKWQLEILDSEKAPSNNSVLQECFRNKCNQEQLKYNPDKKVYLVDSGLKQRCRMEVLSPQYQECPSSELNRHLQNKVPDLTHLPQQRLENPKNRQSCQTYSEENCREETTRENQCPKITRSHDTVHCQGSKKGNLPQGLCNGLGHLS